MADEEPTIVLREEARRLGLKRFFTGHLCRSGHLDERYVSSGQCLSCCKVFKALSDQKDPERWRRYAATYQLVSREKYLAKTQRYIENNRDACRRNAKKWRDNNRDRIANYRKASKELFPDRNRIASRKYYKKNAEKRRKDAKEYRLKNPEKVELWYATRRARKLGSAGSYTRGDIARIAKLQRNRCACCGVKLNKSNRHIDHIVALARGGINEPRNLQLLCRPCNQSKSSRDPVEFMQSNGRLL